MSNRFLFALSVVSLAALSGCGASASQEDPAAAGDWSGFPSEDAGSNGEWASDTGGGGIADTASPGTPPTDAGTGGSFGGVGTGGAQDFAFFRKAITEGRIPSPDSIDAAGFFAEHYTTLPNPTCGKTFCLHGMMSRSPDIVRGGDWTLLQMAMNSPVDPATVKKPALELAVVLDRSGSMGAAGKMDFAKQGVTQLVDALGPEDRLTVIVFDDRVQTLFGPSTVTDKTALKNQILGVQPGGSTNLYDSLKAGYDAIGGASELQQRRVIFLTDGLATAGNTDSGAITAMSATYNAKHLGLTTIGLGADVSLPLLRGLAEQGGGNFYYVEKPEAVTEVFTEELAFFVAPIAYDLELSYTQLPSYKTKAVHGTNLFKTTADGGKIFVPSVFLVSRTSSEPGPSGGRRGGGSAIIAELGAIPGTESGTASTHDVAKLSLKYRLPGTTTYESQELTVQHDGTVVAPYYANTSIDKNEIILSFYVAFRDATKLAQTDKVAAKKLLEDFLPKVLTRIGDRLDEDLADDVVILGKLIDILAK